MALLTGGVPPLFSAAMGSFSAAWAELTGLNIDAR
jgi:hypothetical protein